MPNRMTELRNALTEMGVSYEDNTSICPTPFMDMSIYRTKYTYNGNDYSVICGYGTYGGGQGLLEVMVNGEEPFGHLTVEDILEIMKERKQR